MLYPARLNRNLERKIGHEIFVKTEKTEYLSNQLTYAHFDRKFIFPIKFGTSEQIFIFWISKMFHISGSPTVNTIFFHRHLDFEPLITNEEERKAFFINLYNIQMIHGLVAQENLPETPTKVQVREWSPNDTVS